MNQKRKWWDTIGVLIAVLFMSAGIEAARQTAHRAEQKAESALTETKKITGGTWVVSLDNGVRGMITYQENRP